MCIRDRLVLTTAELGQSHLFQTAHSRHSQLLSDIALVVISVDVYKRQEGDYTEKLTAIIANNNIKSVTVVRMEVPCCGGIENAVKSALQASGKFLPWRVVTISTDGRILD